jgi:hypothetical protein
MERFVSALIALTLVSVPSGIGAQDTEWNRYTLEGLGGVFIRAEADSACESAGVTASKVQSDAALQLLETEVALLTRDEMLALPGLPELRITVECADGDNGGSAALGYSVSLRVQQAVKLIRNEQITLSEAVTWYSTALGTADAAGVQDAVLSTLTSELADFATAYVEANAEEGTPR